jgi:lia operon protein LiaG
MSGEKMKILELIEKKIISPEEGLKLLEALEKVDEVAIVSNDVKEELKSNIMEELEEQEEIRQDEIEEIAEELEDLAGEIEEEVEDIIEELEEAFEDVSEEIDIEIEIEEQLQEKIDEIKRKATELKDKFQKEFSDVNADIEINFDKDQFKNDMKNLKHSLKFEMKGLSKEANRFGKELSRLGKETAKLTKDLVNEVMANVDVNVENMGKDFNKEDFVMNNDKETKKYNLAQEFTINCEGKEEIAIDVISTDITVITEDREEILVNYIKYNPKDSDKFVVVVEEDSKKIRISEKVEKPSNSFFNFNISSSAKELVVRLPHKYKDSLSVKTVSGDLNINYLDSSAFRFSTVSGDIKADIIYSINSLVKTTSGDCKIDLFRGNMMYTSVSGDVELCYEVLDGDFALKSVSGDARLLLPKTSEFEVIAKTMSGDLKCDFPITFVGQQKKNKLRGQVGSDANSISASTTSGDLTIIKY